VYEPSAGTVPQLDPHHRGVVGPHVQDAVELGPGRMLEGDVLAAQEAGPVLDIGIVGGGGVHGGPFERFRRLPR
jgi:hypothetical protein